MSTILNKADILENDIREQYPNILDLLLIDQTTTINILWATDNYQDLGKGYESNAQISSSV